MKTNLFNYNLPPELIAQNPLASRESSRLLVCNAEERSILDRNFQELPELLNSLFNLKKRNARLLLITNNSFVYPARVRIKRKTGAKGEVFFLGRGEKQSYQCLLRPKNKLKVGEILYADREEEIPLIKIVQLSSSPLATTISPFASYRTSLVTTLVDDIEAYGEMPLPPYIQRKSPQPSDKERYQTVYANKNEAGSSAAPTAGLHFDAQTIKKCQESNIEFASVTLHVGLGTFAPVQTENISEHSMHSEYYYISKETTQKIAEFLAHDWPIVFVGTTSLRAVESFFRELVAAAKDDRHPERSEGSLTNTQILRFAQDDEITQDDRLRHILHLLNTAEEKWRSTNLFIHPKNESDQILPCIGNGILTNFHQPESTLTMLIAALMGYDFWTEFYSHAINQKYRFLSYGDSSLLLFRTNFERNA